MPPFKTDRPIWHGVDRQVVIREASTQKGVKCSVVVTFTRKGYSNDTQQRIEELAGECEVATNLSRRAAMDLKRTVEDVCSQSYAQGHSDGRKR